MRREYPGTVKLLARGIEKIEAAPSEYMGIDAKQLAADAQDAHDALVELGPDRFGEWDQRHIPKISIVTDS